MFTKCPRTENREARCSKLWKGNFLLLPHLWHRTLDTLWPFINVSPLVYRLRHAVRNHRVSWRLLCVFKLTEPTILTGPQYYVSGIKHAAAEVHLQDTANLNTAAEVQQTFILIPAPSQQQPALSPCRQKWQPAGIRIIERCYTEAPVSERARLSRSQHFAHLGHSEAAFASTEWPFEVFLRRKLGGKFLKPSISIQSPLFGINV